MSLLFFQTNVDTDRGYVIHISGEALQKSTDGLRGANLIVSLLNETLFRVSSSLNTKVCRMTVCLYLKDLFVSNSMWFYLLWATSAFHNPMVSSLNHLSLWCWHRRGRTQVKQAQYCMGKLCWEFGLVKMKFRTFLSLFSSFSQTLVRWDAFTSPYNAIVKTHRVFFFIGFFLPVVHFPFCKRVLLLLQSENGTCVYWHLDENGKGQFEFHTIKNNPLYIN